MGFDEGRIILDKENGNYVAGQTLYGRVVFDQGKPKDIHGIYISCKGFCKVHWTTTRRRRVNNRTHTRIINHESYEEYFKEKYFIIGSDGGDCHIKEGHHEYAFSCAIPGNCPSSFEGEYGHIRYRVKVVMVTSGLFSFNKEKRVALQVHAPVDLNQNPYCKAPVEYELNNTYCCWCMSAGFSEVRVKLPVGGYCPGQVIPIEVSVVNQSRVEIDELKFSIMQVIRFIATTNPGTRYDNNTVATIKKGPIPANTTRNWQVDMEVPAVDTYNVDGCRYIDMEAVFKVSVEAEGCHDDSEESHAIIIGDIPLIITEDMVHIPLHDQNEQSINYYPSQPTVQQTFGNSNYPNQMPGFGGQPYPPSGSSYPSSGSPYPPSGSPYPPRSPYSGRKDDAAAYSDVYMPQPPQNPAYGISGPGPSYPTETPAPPYPTNPSGGNTAPYSSDPPPYPGIGSLPYIPPKDTNENKTPYPKNDVLPSKSGDSVQSYPARNSVPPYPTSETMPSHDSKSSGPSYSKNTPGGSASASNITSGLKTGTIGFAVPVFGEAAKTPSKPSVPPYPTSPATSPSAAPSAPEPSTPGSDNSTPSIPLSRSPAYNPDFVDKDKE